MFYDGFPSLGNSDHVLVSVSIDFPSYSQRDAPIYRLAYDRFRADWDALGNHLGDVSWEGIFKLNASAAASEFCVWVQVGIDVYIFSAACVVAIIHTNHFFHFYQRINLLNIK